MEWAVVVVVVGFGIGLLLIKKNSRPFKADPCNHLLTKTKELDDLFEKVKKVNEIHNKHSADSSFTIIKDSSTQIEVDFQKMLLIETSLDLDCGQTSEYWLRSIENKWVIFLYSQKVWTNNKIDNFEYSVKYSRVNKEPLEKYLKAIRLPYDLQERIQDLQNRMKGLDIENNELSKMISKHWNDFSANFQANEIQ